MTSRISLVEQKKLQWAKEREELARLNGHHEPPKHHQQIRTNIRTYPSITRLSSREANGTCKNKPLRAVGHYGSTTSLRSVGLADHHHSANTTTSLQTLDFSTGSLVNLLDGTDFPGSKRRSPSLPPIYTKDNHHSSQPQGAIHNTTATAAISSSRGYSDVGRNRNDTAQFLDRFTLYGHGSSTLRLCETSYRSLVACTACYICCMSYPARESADELGVEGSRYNNQPRPQKHHYRQTERNLGGGHNVQHPYDVPEGETSGYASDSVEAPVPSGPLADSKRVDSEMSERTWQNPYCDTPETSLPPSRRLSITRLSELNRPRWGSVWGQENGRADPPPPSWLERGLSRLDNASQVLVINHDSASSPDSSTTGSTGSDSKTYIRGQNIPVDAQVLQEREARRQRALELQNAIKQQLEEKDRQRKAEKERRLREEREEEERIKRERDREKQRFEEEQRRIREKECLKLKKEEAMREILQSAERKAKEEKRRKMRREEPRRDQEIPRSDQEIPRRDQEIPRRDQETPRRDQEIPRRDQEISRRDQEIPRRNQETSRRDQETPRRDQEISRRDQEISRRDQETPRRDQETARRDQEISRRDQEIPIRDQEILRRDQAHSRRDQEIPRRDQEIPIRDHEIPRRDQEIPRRDQETPRETLPESNCWDSPRISHQLSECASQSFPVQPILEKLPANISCETFGEKYVKQSCKHLESSSEIANEHKTVNGDFCQSEMREENTVRLPVGKEVAIVLSGRLEDPEFLNKANLQLVNLVVTPSPRKHDHCSSNVNNNLTAFAKSFANAGFCRRSPRSPISPRLVENRILTPSKYRNSGNFAQGRDFGTQTDGECEMQDPGSKESSIKDPKDVVNNNRRDVEKSTNTGTGEESVMKPLARSKSQPRTTLETRPRWNANRPGTRYRTQSEKDPHYQRRMRLRRRRVESSDERSRSPSPDRRKSSNQKSKTRNSCRRKVKIDNYDADLSMDSLNSVVPLRVDEHGRINILPGNNKHRNKGRREKEKEARNEEKLDVWCGQEILTQLASLRNGLLSKQREWDPQRCLVSPSADFY